MITIEMFADLLCPYAYVVHATWRRILPEVSERFELVHRSLSLEYVNNEPTPKMAIATELPVLILEDDTVEYVPWKAPDSEWPVTVMPAFEAVNCAMRQGVRQADDLAWRIRLAIFRDNLTVSLRNVLFDLASETGLDMQRFASDFDSGVGKQQVIDDARLGWEELRVPGSPTWRLPAGELINDFGLAEMSIDDDWRVRLTRRGLPPDERAAAMLTLIESLGSS